MGVQARYLRDYLAGNSVNTSSHWVQISAWDINGNDVALGKPVTLVGGTASSLNPPSIVTSGSARNSFEYLGTDSSPVYVEIDFGAIYMIAKVVVWHYFADGRSYNKAYTDLSMDGSSWTTVSTTISKNLLPKFDQWVITDAANTTLTNAETITWNATSTVTSPVRYDLYDVWPNQQYTLSLNEYDAGMILRVEYFTSTGTSAGSATSKTVAASTTRNDTASCYTFTTTATTARIRIMFRSTTATGTYVFYRPQIEMSTAASSNYITYFNTPYAETAAGRTTSLFSWKAPVVDYDYNTPITEVAFNRIETNAGLLRQAANILITDTGNVFPTHNVEAALTTCLNAIGEPQWLYTENFSSAAGSYIISGTTINSVSGSIIRVTSTNADAHISFEPSRSNGWGFINQYAARYFEIRYRYISGTIPSDIALYYTTEANPGADAARVLTTPIISDGQWYVVLVDGWASGAWKTGGYITGVRFDWCMSSGTVMEFDYIGLKAVGVI